MSSFTNLAKFIILFVVNFRSFGCDNHITVEINEICTDTNCTQDNNNNNQLQLCPNPATQFYDTQTKTCHSLLGEACTVNANCSSTAICAPVWSSTKGTFEGQCCCDKNYFPAFANNTAANSSSTTSAIGGCIRKARYGEPCHEETKPCEDNNSLMFCNPESSTCTCLDESVQIYDLKKQVCAIRVGEYCYGYRSEFHICVTNAICKFHFGHHLPDKIRCACKPGFVQNSKGECVGSYGHACSVVNAHPHRHHHHTATSRKNGPTEQQEVSTFDGCDADIGLVCTNGQCLCRSLLYQVFDDKLRSCANIIGSLCTRNSSWPGESCISHAHCSGSREGRCECGANYSPTANGLTCKRNYGQFCNNNDTGLGCNYDAGLVCRGQRCSCFDETLKYDEGRETCVNHVGGRCGRLPSTINKHNWVWKTTLTYFNDTRYPIRVGCEAGLVCGKAQAVGEEHCVCMDTISDDGGARTGDCDQLGVGGHSGGQTSKTGSTYSGILSIGIIISSSIAMKILNMYSTLI